ncbi:TolB-like protein/AraC-like DNA-binding protein/Tfp pilus assembly protein PilF [Algoriphagus sp. 4150]|uniref:helix-turn-helix domain-containing protein n=1 Tax=Algoriphagus sp. 4150 TaxID=2817756 RepID=UPI00285E450B|nr:helix-turn-helix domain-containing protein [Algoriphagus sp. 4150]MDR7128892.1 TolB-like protein/AraC-like DNA-binding protein/Tfp pilus assembly protein PilF [Algoriphagus sp. 4150]
MSELPPQEKEFLAQLIAKINLHIADEEFGVAHLADEMNMSRSNLLRKVKKTTNLSVSQFINKIRLEQAMGLLRDSSRNVSEVSHQVGFNSPSYFIKCFREHYGYPPGEVGKHPETVVEVNPEQVSSKSGKRKWMPVALGIVLLFVMGGIWMSQDFFTEKLTREKSIIVLPFKNESTDSSNVYLINGLMEATLSNLQKIKDLRVLSRTSAEKYRESKKSMPEMADELNVNYLVEGSGQKMGDKIVLNIQLIDGAKDRHLWSKQYRREIRDIFALQQEISKDIAKEIQAIITPEEKSRIEKEPTENLKAYDSFMKGLDLLNKGGDEYLLESVRYFEEAIREDGHFALAHACAGIAFYYYDIFRSEKVHLDKLGTYADKAMLYDPSLGESLTAKAMYYLLKKEYSQALPFLEKGLEYRPNSSLIIGLLADFYANHLPDTEKYLEYALSGVQLDAGSSDSVATSYFYLRLGNALIQTGFVDESSYYIDKSLDYFSGNMYSRYVRAFVSFAQDYDLSHTRELLKIEFDKDTSRFDILQDLGKVSYYLRDYDSAYYYYERFDRFRQQQNLNVYVHENMLIGVVFEKIGKIEEGRQFIESYRGYLEKDQTAYKNLGFTMYYAHEGDFEKALSHFRLFAKEDHIQYWVILFLNKDPIADKIKNHPEFKEIWVRIEEKFWANNAETRTRLEEQGLL